MSSLAVPGRVRSGPARTLRVIWRHRAIYVMLAAPLLYFLLFRYAPLWNAQIAFKDFSPIDGVMRSPWIGFRHFLTFFRSIYFGQLIRIRNTLGYSLAKLLVGMPTAILLALALAETTSRRLRNVVQTASYLPHFLSWVIMYEAASVEGASRMQRIRWISLPGILPVVVVITLLRLGNILDAGFQQIFVLYSLPVYSVSDILDTWIYRSGILDFQLSLASAVGLFKGVIGLALIVTANRLARRAAGSGLY
jgi:ABC-type polysaccharide transport system permease subunit